MPKRDSFYVRIEDMRHRPNVVAGMNPYVLLGLVNKLRRTTEDHEPVTVRRHRFMASMIAGRADVLAVEE